MNFYAWEEDKCSTILSINSQNRHLVFLKLVHFKHIISCKKAKNSQNIYYYRFIKFDLSK